MSTHFVDLAQAMPEELMTSLGEAMILFGRLEHMVLLSIKRVRGISLAEAEVQYKGTSLGTKLNGNSPCPDTGEKCRNRNNPIGLRELAKGNSELEKICEKIQELTSKRNRLMHGLMTTVAESSVVLHNRKIFDLTESEVWELSDEVKLIILSLNELIPIPGLTASYVTGPGIDIDYGSIATDPSDPLVRIIESTN